MKYLAIGNIIDKNGNKVLGNVEKIVASPNASIIGDKSAFESAVVNALQYVVYNETLAKINSMQTQLEELQSKEKVDKEKVTSKLHDIEVLKTAFEGYSKKVKIKNPDPFELVIAFAITGSRLIGISKIAPLADIITKCDITKVDDVRKVKKVLMERLTEFFGMDCSYMASNIKPHLNDEKIVNLSKIAQSYTLKWSKKGIAEKRIEARALIQQLILEVFRTAFNLQVTANKGIDKDAIISI